MKNLIIYTFLLLSPACLYANPDVDSNQQKREELYERMSMNVFFTHFNIQRSTLPNEDKKIWMQESANIAFYYWVTTRKGGIKVSEKVDGAIALIYERAVSSKMIEGFSDPIQRKKLDGLAEVNVVGIPKMSDKLYRDYVEEFQVFLKHVLKERSRE